MTDSPCSRSKPQVKQLEGYEIRIGHTKSIEPASPLLRVTSHDENPAALNEGSRDSEATTFSSKQQLSVRERSLEHQSKHFVPLPAAKSLVALDFLS
jgi:hypothetical protein